MRKYVMRRLFLAIPVLLLSSVMVFGLMRVMPGDALTALMAESGNVSERELQKLRKDLGLDLPYHEQYLIWIWQMVTFNPGYSIFTSEPISSRPEKVYPGHHRTGASGMVLGLVIAIPVGVLSATRQDKLSDYMGRLVAISGLSLPDFWLGTLVITFAAIWFGWIPRWAIPAVGIAMEKSPTIPVAGSGAGLSPLRRDHAYDPLDPAGGVAEDYVRTAWAKGLGGTGHHLQTCAEKRPHPGGHHRRRAIGHAPGRHRDRRDDLRAAGDGPADR